MEAGLTELEGGGCLQRNKRKLRQRVICSCGATKQGCICLCGDHVPIGKSCTRSRPHTFKGKSVKRRIWCMTHQRHYNKDQKHAENHVLCADNICRPQFHLDKPAQTCKEYPMPQINLESEESGEWRLSNFMPTAPLDTARIAQKNSKHPLSSGSGSNMYSLRHSNEPNGLDDYNDAEIYSSCFSPSNISHDAGAGILSLPSPQFSPFLSPNFESGLDCILDSTFSYEKTRCGSLSVEVSASERVTKNSKVEDDFSFWWVKLKLKGLSATTIWTCLGFSTSATASRIFQEIMDMLDSGMISMQKVVSLLRTHVLIAQKGSAAPFT
jgi:hypothetical protein